MNNYVCKYGLYHDKPVREDKEPRSNNGWIYTAYAKELGLPIKSEEDYSWLSLDCQNDSGVFLSNRLPGKKEPPISRDEIIGLGSLVYSFNANLLEKDYYYSLFTSDDFRFIHSLKAVWSLRDKHRNHVWENKMYAAYPIVFRLPIHDRYYFKVKNNHRFHIGEPLEWLMFQLYCLVTIIKPSNTTGRVSAKNILWLQLRHLHSVFWIKFINQEKNFLEYFGEDHIFNLYR